MLRAISNVTYARGYTLTSTLLAVTPSTLGPVKATDRAVSTIDDFAAGIDDWTFGPAYTDPYIDWSYLQAGAGPNGSSALTLNPVAWGDGPIHYVVGTHKVGDPKWTAPAKASLSFQFRAEKPGTLELHVFVDQWGPQAREYVAVIAPDGSAGWQAITVKADQCATRDGGKLSEFSTADRIEFVGQSPANAPPLFAKVRWVTP